MFPCTESEANLADTLTPRWDENLIPEQMVSESDYFGSDYDGTDWDEYYAWQAHETFTEWHPED